MTTKAVIEGRIFDKFNLIWENDENLDERLEFGNEYNLEKYLNEGVEGSIWKEVEDELEIDLKDYRKSTMRLYKDFMDAWYEGGLC